MNKILIVWMILSACFFLQNMVAQSTNLARLEYTYIPQADSDNTYSRIRAELNYPIKLKKEGAYLVLGAGYRNNSFQIKDTVVIADVTKLENFQTFGLNVGYTFLLKNNWRFAAKVGLRISSNFEDSGILADDLRYSGTLLFIKSYKYDSEYKKARLLIGSRYSNPASINFPLPIINFTKRFHPSWSYSLGTPKTNIKYFLGEKHAFQAFVSLDRFFGNIQNSRIVIDENGNARKAESASMLIINSALGYEYLFTKHLLFFVYGGYTLSNEIRLRDREQENVFLFNEKNTVYFRTGIKLKI